MNTIQRLQSSALPLALAACVEVAAPRFAPVSMTAPAGSATVTGHVTGSDGSPLSGADVSISGTDRRATTDASGNYTLSNLSAGPIEVVVSHDGYATTRSQSRLSATGSKSGGNRVDLTLFSGDEIASLGARASRDSVQLERVGFLERQSTLRSAYFVTPEEIAELEPRTISDIFRHVPVLIETIGRSKSAFAGSGSCFITYVDGMMRRVMAPSELETFLPARKVLAAEVYPAGQLPPARFPSTSSRINCTTVALWTRP